MRKSLLLLYHLCLRGLGLLGLPLLIVVGHQGWVLFVDNGMAHALSRLLFVVATAPLCVVFVVPNWLPRHLRHPNLRELGPFLFVGLGLIGVAAMSIAQAAVTGLTLAPELAHNLSRVFGVVSIGLGGMSGLLALTLCNQATTPAEHTARRHSDDPRPSAQDLRALRHARMGSANVSIGQQSS